MGLGCGAAPAPVADVSASARAPEADFRVEIHPGQMQEQRFCAKLLSSLSDVGAFANAELPPVASAHVSALSLYVWEGQGAPAAARQWAWLLGGVDANDVPQTPASGISRWRVQPTTWAYGDMSEGSRWWLAGPELSLCAPDARACAQFRGGFLRARVSQLREGPLAVVASGLLRVNAGLSGTECKPEARFVYVDSAHAEPALLRLQDVLHVTRKRTEEAGWGELKASRNGSSVTIETK